MSTRSYYEDELAYLRELGVAFGRANPRIAGMLAQRTADPDVERLLEGFAFLTGKLRQRLDDELPELSHGLLAILQPHYLRPVPAMSVVEFAPDPGGISVRLPGGTAVAARPVEGTACLFRTCGELAVLPLAVTVAGLDERAASATLTLRLTATQGGDAPRAAAGGVRLFLHGGSDARLGPVLLHALLSELTQLSVSDGRRTCPLPPQLRQGGFAEDDAMLPWPPNSAPGYRVLQEYLAFPERFLFVDLPPLPPGHGLDGSALTYTFAISRSLQLAAPLGPGNLRLNCVPVVNLFDTQADPIRPAPGQIEYRLRPSASRSPHARIHGIGAVRGFVQGRPGHILFEPFETFRHALPGAAGHFFRARPRPAVTGRGADTWLSFVDGADGALVPRVDLVSVDVTCTDGQLAELVPMGGIDQVAPGSPATGGFRNITPVLPEIAAPLGGEALWRLVAGLARGLRPLDDVDALRQLIAGYDFRAAGDEQARRRLELLLGGLRQVSTRGFDTVLRGIPVRGREVTLLVDRSGFAGLADIHLFGAVLDAFLGVYAGLNTAWRLRLHEAQTNTRFDFPVRFGAGPAL